ncbi:hypothetical protein HDU96_010370 [Phlyctochytrium bullatum]|nr:hypothetical protein HDU96_010370 [Phlyctochytrium bullatum]
MVEVIRNVLLASGDLQAAIDYEVLHAGIHPRFYFRINSNPEAGPVIDAVMPLRAGVKAKFRPDLVTFKYVMKAARAGLLDLIRLLDAYRVPRFCKGTFDEGGGGGHLEVVKYLHKEMEQEPSLSSYGEDGKSVRLGSLQVDFCVLRFLREELEWPVPSDYLLHAILAAKPDEFRYYLRCVPDFSSEDAALLFSRPKNWLPMLKILHEFHGDKDDIWVARNSDQLAKQGHVDMLEFLYKHRQEGCTESGLRAAARAGHVVVIKLLVAKGLKPTRSLLHDAVMSNCTELLRFCRSLPQLDRLWDLELAKYALKSGGPASLCWLLEELGLGFAELHPWPDYGSVDVTLYAIQEQGLAVPDQPFLVRLLERAAWHGSLEQVKAVSKLTSGEYPGEYPEAYVKCATEGRLDILKFLCETWAERVDLRRGT